MKHSDSGIYHFIFELKKSVTLKIGAAGEYYFEKGAYVYTGTAQSGLAARIARHARKDKKLHWHIDYVTSHASCEYIGAYFKPDATAGHECKMNMRIIINADWLISKFGASDCVSCPSHLAGFTNSKDALALMDGLVKLN